jgi:hypothetical protein
MISLDHSATERIAKLVELLASEHDGEALGAARALKRTLLASKADFHDLAALISASACPKENRYHPAAVPLWAEMQWQQRCAWLDALWRSDFLSPWESEFIARLRSHAMQLCQISVSPKQAAVLNALIWKAADRGVDIGAPSSGRASA